MRTTLATGVVSDHQSAVMLQDYADDHKCTVMATRVG